MMQESEYVEMTRKQLYDEIWELSVSGVADKYHLVYTKLIVTCKQENIPYPSSGYWTKKNMGKDVSDEVAELTDFLKTCKEVKVKSIYSHLAAADEESCDEFTLGQISLFKKNADIIASSLGYKPLYHVLNSAGIERFPQYQFDMVRLGIGIYGVSALPGNHLSPVASFKCKVLQVKTLKPED